MNTVEKIREASTYVGSRVRAKPQVAVVLGSGLGGFAESLSDRTAIPFSAIPHFPRSSVQGHSGSLIAGTFQGVPLFVMAGRVHAYEGYGAEEVVFPARVLSTLGVKMLILTNAAGAVNTAFKPGELMILTDHINWTGLNPLAGPEYADLGQRFTDMTEGYHPKLVAACEQSARRIGLNMRKGVYLGLLGPSFETPAEIRMFRTLGADAVGMSTVLECIAANQMGVKVLGISCITNMAAGILPRKLDHREVMEVGAKVKSVMEELLAEVVPPLAKLV
ncbi:MAG TPA: purine-nucleoside phosphorylase [Vicinamibacteria bacterium]|nr:purine-nucleoside phosphorylase [Vicinamibacteria bacterium]